MEKKKFLGVIIPLSDMFSRGVGWAFISTMPLFIEADVYGIIVLFYALEILLSNVFVIGQDKYVIRYFSEKIRITESVLIQIFILALLAVVIYVSLPKVIGEYFTVPIFFFFTISVLLSNINRIYLSKYRVENRVKNFSIQRVLSVSSRVLLFYILSLLCDFEIIMSFALSFLFSSLIVSTLYIKELIHDINKYTFSLDELKLCIKFGCPISIHLFFASIMSHGDKFIINSHMDSSQVGVYTFSYMLGSGFTFILAAFSIYYEPLIYKHAECEFKQEREISKFFKLCVIGLVIYMSVIYLLQFLRIYFDVEIYFSESIMLISLLSHFLNSIYLKSSFRLYSQGRSLNVSIVTIFSCLVNFLANLYLIPRFQLQGAILATLMSSTILAIVMTYISLDKKRKLLKDLVWIIIVWSISMLIIFGR